MKYEEVPAITGKATLYLRTQLDTYAIRRWGTILGPPIQHGYRDVGEDGTSTAWGLYPSEDSIPSWQLPIRWYRKRKAASVWIGFVERIEEGWT